MNAHFICLVFCLIATMATAQELAKIVAPEPNPCKDSLNALCQIINNLKDQIPKDKMSEISKICTPIYY
ncbi:hypothetical protein GCK72_006785 [Caenorhabditis remanei]|uniref:Saposin B-type domain-containing protein n=1 Tax=Caenorhabditis remanei TaxID=31234 RepID=A0A6A5HJP4_CAERE|nr:hypothetical protein GCK72_006785 [Caenorhabditis remanei]KAF1766827.1 hypothetical protein GCK72_006785 [Caenorhabditis remanei]